MTFLDIFQDVARRCDKNPTNPDPETNTRLRTFINDRYRELMRMPGVMDLRDEVFDNNALPYTFQSVVGVNRVVLPATVTAITSVMDSTNRVLLQQRTLTWIRERDPSSPGTASGTPAVYALLGRDGVLEQAQMMSPNQATLSSSSGTDTGLVTIEYQDADGAFRAVQVSLAGTTPVAVPATLRQLFRMSLDTVQSGMVTLAETATFSTLAVIPANTLLSQTSNLHTSRGWVLWLWPTPSGVNSYTVDGTRPRAALVEDMDEPSLPEDFHTLLVWGACEDELIHMDDTRFGVFADRWRKDVAALKGFLHQVRGQRLIPRGGRQRPGWSPLGGNYPPWQ